MENSECYFQVGDLVHVGSSTRAIVGQVDKVWISKVTGQETARVVIREVIRQAQDVYGKDIYVVGNSRSFDTRQFQLLSRDPDYVPAPPTPKPVNAALEPKVIPDHYGTF